MVLGEKNLLSLVRVTIDCGRRMINRRIREEISRRALPENSLNDAKSKQGQKTGDLCSTVDVVLCKKEMSSSFWQGHFLPLILLAMNLPEHRLWQERNLCFSCLAFCHEQKFNTQSEQHRRQEQNFLRRQEEDRLWESNSCLFDAGQNLSLFRHGKTLRRRQSTR